jgi:hypothetical protein
MADIMVLTPVERSLILQHRQQTGRHLFFSEEEEVVDAPAASYHPLVIALGMMPLPEDPGANHGAIGSDSKGRNRRAEKGIWHDLTVRCGEKIKDVARVTRLLQKDAGLPRALAIHTVIKRNGYAHLAVNELLRQIQEDEELRAPFENWDMPSVLEFHINWHLDRLAAIGAISVNY